MSDPTLPKTPHNVRNAYGMALEAAGLANANQNIDNLLDDGYQEKFYEYFPRVEAFEQFLKRFEWSCRKMMERLSWPDYDPEKLKTPPKREQSINDYYNNVFKPAVLNVAEQ